MAPARCEPNIVRLSCRYLRSGGRSKKCLFYYYLFIVFFFFFARLISHMQIASIQLKWLLLSPCIFFNHVHLSFIYYYQYQYQHLRENTKEKDDFMLIYINLLRDYLQTIMTQNFGEHVYGIIAKNMETAINNHI